MEQRGILNIESRDDVVIVCFNTAIIGATCGIETLGHDLRDIILQRQPAKMVVDFRGVAFFSSNMLGLLVDVWRRMKDCGGTVVISGINPNLTRVFRITNLDKVFSFYPNTESALKALAQPAGV